MDNKDLIETPLEDIIKEFKSIKGYRVVKTDSTKNKQDIYRELLYGLNSVSNIFLKFYNYGNALNDMEWFKIFIEESMDAFKKAPEPTAEEIRSMIIGDGVPFFFTQPTKDKENETS